jgi:hypothetical protein
MKLRQHLITILCVWLFLGLIVAAFALAGIKMTKICRDPSQLADFPFYYGLLSNLGILVWAAGSFIPFFSCFLVNEAKAKSLLRWAGILTLVLLLDDFLLIHDAFFPEVLHLPDKLFYVFYLLAFPLFFYRHFGFILKQTEFRILALGLFLMGVSVLIDANLLPGGIDVEDSFKLYGMVAYSYYWIVTSHRLIVRSSEAKSAVVQAVE